MAESAQSDERGTDEASCWKDMQSSFDKCNPHSVKDYVIGRIQSGMIFETCVPMCICSFNNCEFIWCFVICIDFSEW